MINWDNKTTISEECLMKMYTAQYRSLRAIEKLRWAVSRGGLVIAQVGVCMCMCISECECVCV